MSAELCVTGEDLARLLAAPVGTIISNGPDGESCYFVKTGADEWRWSTALGMVPDGDCMRPFEQRFDDPIWAGPFESRQIHAYNLEYH